MAVKILAFAGSAREESFNKKVVKIAAEAASLKGASVTLVDLKDFPMPIYDQDLEESEGLPENAKKFKKLMQSHDGFLISTPEYNSAIPPLLKNALDWVSRKEVDGEVPLAAYRGKAVALMSASPGGLGGLRALTMLRGIMSNLGVLILPEQRAVSKAHEMLGEDGGIKDEKLHTQIEQLGSRLVGMISTLKGKQGF